MRLYNYILRIKDYERSSLDPELGIELPETFFLISINNCIY